MSNTNETTWTEKNEANEASESALPPAGHIQKVGMLDLRSAKTPEDLQGFTGISEVGCVLIPEHLATALARIPMKNVGTVVPVPEDKNINIQIGQVRLSGEALAAGNPEEILFVAGQLYLTSPPASIGYKEIWVHGQLFALRGSEGVLGAKLTRVTGQTFYLPARSRTFMGEETLGKGFLELLSEPTVLVIMGKLTLEDDVTVELLKSQVPEIILMGEIEAQQALVPLLQVLTIEKMGEIKAKA